MTTLKKGVHASDLDQTLSSTGPFTLFAPSDLAFGKLEEGTIESLGIAGGKNFYGDLLEEEKDKYRAIVKWAIERHVASQNKREE